MTTHSDSLSISSSSSSSVPRRVSFQMEDENDTRDCSVRFALPEQEKENKEVHLVQAESNNITWLTEEDCRERWYQKDELSAMKRAVRMAILYGISDEIENQQSEPSAFSFGVGLGRFSLERSQHKRSAIYHILMAQQHARQQLASRNHSMSLAQQQEATESWIRRISRRCTAWARHISAEEGFATFCEVYGDPIVEETPAEEAWDLFHEYAGDLLTMSTSDEESEDVMISTAATTPCITATSNSISISSSRTPAKRKLLEGLEPISPVDCNRNVRPRLNSIASTPSTPILTA